MRTYRLTHLICLLLIVVTLAVYRQVIDCDFVNFDDDVYVTDNARVQAGLTRESVVWAFTATRAGLWIPATWLSLMFDRELYGLNPGGYHLTNLLLHAANSLLLFLVLRQMTGALWRSAFVAALFALHPLHVESVAWVTERKDVLSTFFWMLTMSAYFHYVKDPTRSRYLLIILFFAIGLMAKPMVVTLPFVLLLLDCWPLGRRDWGRLLKEKAPLFAIAAVAGLVTFFAQLDIGAVRSLDALPLKIRISNALVAYVGYIGKTIWPHALAVYYPHQRMPSSWHIAAGGSLLVGISALAIFAGRKRPYLAVGWLWYLGTLVPVIGLLQAGSQGMADRFTYVPLIGLFVMIAWGVSDLLEGRPRQRVLLAVLAGGALSALALCTWSQVRYWQNSITLFEHTLGVTSNNDVAHYNLGVSLGRLGRTDEAISHYLEVLHINPGFVRARNNLGVLLDNRGQTDEAINQYLEVLRVRPDHGEAHYNLGAALAKRGCTDEAIKHYLEALRIKPDHENAHYNLAGALAKLGRTDKAIKHYLEALRIRPDFEEAHNNLGIVLMNLGRTDKAITHYLEALRLKPDDEKAHFNLGIALERLGRTDEAINHYMEALRIKPDYANAHLNLGIALERQGRTDEAIDHYMEALRIKPDFAEARNRLHVSLVRKGKDEPAVGY